MEVFSRITMTLWYRSPQALNLVPRLLQFFNVARNVEKLREPGDKANRLYVIISTRKICGKKVHPTKRNFSLVENFQLYGIILPTIILS